MTSKDEAINISNPRLLSAIYFALLAIIANLIIDTLLYNLGVQLLMPTFKALLLAAGVAGIFGALFGKKIICCPYPFKKRVFGWAFLMVIIALPFHTLGFLLFFQDSHAHLFDDASIVHLLGMYFLVLFYSFILFGFWLALFAGIAAIYLRGRLIYYFQRALYEKRHVEH